MRLPSAVTATARTERVCRVSTAVSRPRTTSHTRTVVSSDPETAVVPSAETATALTAAA
jgi:hypothetical protein